jgi:hypothetical protein
VRDVVLRIQRMAELDDLPVWQLARGRAVGAGVQSMCLMAVMSVVCFVVGFAAMMPVLGTTAHATITAAAHMNSVRRNGRPAAPWGVR